MVLARRVFRLQFGPAVSAAIAASMLAVLLLALDRAVDAGPDIPTPNARALLGASLGALVTIGAFTFWMRPLAAQMAASDLPPPLLAARLHDDFQRLTVSATVGALTYLSIVLYALPVQGPSPAFATITGALVTIGSIVGLLIGMQRAEQSTRPGRILAAARALVADDLEAVRSAIGREQLDPVEVPAAPARVVRATRSGWVHDVDQARIAAAMPAGSTVRLDACVGSFVTAGWTTLVTVWASDGGAGPQLAEIAAAVAVTDERRAVGDLRGSLIELVDVAVHAALGGSSSPSIVFEAIWNVGAGLHGIIDCDLPGPRRRFDGNRTIIVTDLADHAAIIEPAVQRVRRTAAADPTTAIEVIRVLREVRDHAAAAGRLGAADVLERELDLCVAQCRHSDVLPADLHQVEAARAEAGRARGGGAVVRDAERGDRPLGPGGPPGAAADL